MVSTWMDYIQLRVPGSTVIVVATHVDCATKDQVYLQCQWFKALVETKFKQFEKDELDTGILALRVWSWGESCLDGTGVTQLRHNLVKLAHSLPWWKESIPASYLELQNKIIERKTQRPWLSWPEYAQIASECDSRLEGIRLEIATRFLHDNATLKFFGKHSSQERVTERGVVCVDSSEFQLRFKSDFSGTDWGWRVVVWPAEKCSALLSFDEAALMAGAIVLESAHPYANDCDETHTICIPGATALCVAFDERSRTEKRCDTVALVKMDGSGTWGEESYSGTDYACWPHEALACWLHEAAKILDCVSIDPAWMIDSLKGLIRHSREALLKFFGSESSLEPAEKKTWLRRVQRLAIYGILHAELVTFLWPKGRTALSVTYWEWADSQQDGGLWPRPLASSADDYSKVLSLLSGCGILHKVDEHEFLAPALLANTQRDRLDARAYTQSHGLVHATVMVPIVPDGFFTKLLIKLRPCYSHMDFTVFAAALYGRGHKAQLFLNPIEIKKGEKGDVRSVVKFNIITSTQRQMDQIQSYMREL